VGPPPRRGGGESRPSRCPPRPAAHCCRATMPSKPPSRHRLDERHTLAAPVAHGGDHDPVEWTFILSFDAGGVHRREQLFATERKRGKRDVHGKLPLEATPQQAA